MRHAQALLALVGLLGGCAGEHASAQPSPDQAGPNPRQESPAPEARGCDGVDPHTVGETQMLGVDERNVLFRGGLAIDADGSPRAYHGDGLGLDRLGNAGRPGDWWALVVDGAGAPVVQGPADPAPGFYVSRTSLEDRARPERDPRRYVDASSIPYIVLPGGSANRAWLREHGVSLGDLAVVHNERTGRTAYAIWADNGPARHLGEGSIALAEALGYDNPSPRNGGTEAQENVFLVLGGTGAGWPRNPESIAADAARRFEAWGGPARLERCLR